MKLRIPSMYLVGKQTATAWLLEASVSRPDYMCLNWKHCVAAPFSEVGSHAVLGGNTKP